MKSRSRPDQGAASTNAQCDSTAPRFEVGELNLLLCPACKSWRGEWTHRFWRFCLACGCGWNYRDEITALLVAA